MGERSYAEDSAGSIDALRMCVGEYVPGRAGLRSDMQRAIDGLEQAQVDADDEIAALKAALKDCADDLEAELEDRWRGDHPHTVAKLEREMEPVYKARALLGEGWEGREDG